MRIKYDYASLCSVQHAVSGTGAFAGTEVGRAAVVLGTGGAAVVILARDLGAWAHVFTVQIVDQGGLNQTLGHRFLTPTALKIYAARTGAGITSTAQDVANYINSEPALSQLFAAQAGGTDPVAAVATTALSGGIDPTYTGGVYRYAGVTNQDGGLFVFDHDGPIDVVRVAGRCTVGSDTPVKIQIVDMTQALAPIDAEIFTLHTATLTTAEPSFCLNGPFTLSPSGAVRVIGAAPGTIRVTFQRSARPRLV